MKKVFFKKIRNIVNEKSINQPNKAVKIITDQLKKNKEYQHCKQNWGNIIFNQKPRKRNNCGYNIQELWNMIKILKKNHRIKDGAKFKLNAEKNIPSDITEDKM